MLEKLFQMTQVDPGEVHTLCLGSPCVYWDGDWCGTLDWRVREMLFKTGKASILRLVLGCPFVSGRVVYADCAPNSSLLAKSRAVSPWSSAASQVAAWVCTGDFWRPSLLEMVTLNSSPGVNFSEDFLTFRSSVMRDCIRELQNCYLATWCSPLFSSELPSSS